MRAPRHNCSTPATRITARAARRRAWPAGYRIPAIPTATSSQTCRFCASARAIYTPGEGLAAGALKTIRSNEVGAGLQLNAAIDSKLLGLSDDQAQAWEDQVEREFSLWANSRQCDAGRRFNFGELQALARLSQLMNGDVFALLPVIPRDGERYALRVHLVEADRVCDPLQKPIDADIYGGVEVGDLGEPIAFWIADRFPDAPSLGRLRLVKIPTWTRVPAFGSETGRPLVLHLMEPERIGQRRGIPMLAPVMEKLKQLSRYSHAELMAAVVSGMFTAAITSERPNAMPGQVVAPVQQKQVMRSTHRISRATSSATARSSVCSPARSSRRSTPAVPTPGSTPFVVRCAGRSAPASASRTSSS
jgi:capsid protein